MELLRTRPQWAVFALTGLAAFLYAQLSTQALWYDAREYWRSTSLFHPVDQDGTSSFSLTHFTLGTRGYLFSFILLIVKETAAPFGIPALRLYGALSALAMACLLAILAPRLWENTGGEAPTLGGRLLFAGVGLVLWRGYLLYPLTDLITVTALVAALCCAHESLSPSRSRPVALAYAFAAGALAASLPILRTAYLLASVALLVAFLHRCTRDRAARCATRVGALALGALVVASPQVAINHAQFDSWSPLPPTDRYLGRGLLLQQLSWGLRMQRYESNVGRDFPPARAVFADPVGTSLLRAENVDAFDSMRDYIGFLARHPVDVLSIFARHAFNGLDLLYPTPYVDDPRRVLWGTALLNMLLWYVALARLLRDGPFAKPNIELTPWLIVLLPVLVAVPMAVETRFFWPAHLVGNAIALLPGLPPRSGREILSQNWFPFLLFSLTWLALSRATLAMLQT